MSKLKQYLSILLVVQAVFAIGLYMSGRNTDDFPGDQKLLAVNFDEIDGFEFSSEEGAVKLVKKDGLWQLPEFHNLFANQSKVTELLDKLEGIKQGWPVATTSSAQTRLEVSDDKFQRKVVLSKGGDVQAELFLGSSPAYRSIHARLGDSDDILSVKLATHDLPVKNKDWFDKSVLNAKNLESIKGADFALAKQGDAWQLSLPSAEAPQIDTEKAKDLVSNFDDLSVIDVAENDVDFSQASSFELSGGGSVWTYQFAQKDDKYFVRRSDHSTTFVVGKYAFDQITGVNLSTLALAEPEENSSAKSEEQGEDLSSN